MYNSFPTANNQSADVVVGQPDFASDAVNQGGSAGANTTSAPIDALTKGSKLIVADSSNRRVLIFDDIPDTPKAIFTSSPYQISDGKVRFEGEVSLSGGTHSIWKMEASVNGGPFGNVTSLWDTVRTNPGIPDDKIAKFIHDIEPWENNNSTKEEWTEAKDGYTVRFKAYSTNADTADPFFYFTPFRLNAQSSTLNAPNPTIAFSVNPKQQQLLKDNLDHYEVWVKPALSASAWTKYIDQIPISYDLAREKTDNLLTDLDNITPEGDNGTYENGNLKATYTNDSSSIQVTSKSSAWNPALIPGIYQLKVVAIDKYGHPQETLPQTLTIPKPYPYHVNPNKPRVRGITTIQKGVSLSEQGDSLQKSPHTLPSYAPKPSPSTMPTKTNPILNFLEALFH